MSDAADSDADADAVALFRPRRLEALKPFLDLDDESEESEGIYAEALDDGSFLLHTFQPFALFAASDDVAHTWLDQFGEALGDVHDDPRGILFFPDSIEPEVSTYEGVVEEVGEEGMWIPLVPELDANALAAALPGVDMAALQALAGQLMGGGAPDGKNPAVSSFDIAKMFEGMQGQLADALGIELPGGNANAGVPAKGGASAPADPDAIVVHGEESPPSSSSKER